MFRVIIKLNFIFSFLLFINKIKLSKFGKKNNKFYDTYIKGKKRKYM